MGEAWPRGEGPQQCAGLGKQTSDDDDNANSYRIQERVTVIQILEVKPSRTFQAAPLSPLPACLRGHGEESEAFWG